MVLCIAAMRTTLQQFHAIARLAALETLRQPVVLLLTAACIAFTALLPLLITHVLGDGQRIVRDSALALHLTAGLVLGSYAACASLRDEVRRGTASAVLSKPVDRGLFLLAKFAGLAAVALLFSLLMALATVLTARTAVEDFSLDVWGVGPLLAALLLALVAGGLQNYLFHRPFASRAFGALAVLLPVAFMISGFIGVEGHAAAHFGEALPLASLPASALLALALVLLTGVAASLATRLDVVPTLMVCSFLLLGGLMADYLLAPLAASQPLARAAYVLLPNLQHFWAVDALAQDGIPWRYVGRAAAYAGCYLAGVLGAGILAFRSMELRG